MSHPNFPPIDPTLTHGEALSVLLTTIALEELGLSHLLNAEGEKIQFIPGTFADCGDDCPCAQDVQRSNQSVRELLASAIQYQLLLKGKRDNVLQYIELPPSPPPPCPPKPNRLPKPQPVPASAQRRCEATFSTPQRCHIRPGAYMNWEARTPGGASPARRSPGDCTAILLEPGSPLELSFHASIRCAHGGALSVVVLLEYGGRSCEAFSYHAPFVPRNMSVPLSFNGPLLPAHINGESARVRVVIRAHETVCIERAQLVIRRL